MPTVDAFTESDVPTKRRVLNDIAASRSRVPIDLAIALVRAGLNDRSADVRVSALAAVAGRAVASRWAGTSRPPIGPNLSGTSPAEPRLIPNEWTGDQERLREALHEDCLRRLRSDHDRTVRHYALLALGNLEMPLRPSDPVRTAFVEVLVGLYRNDHGPGIRAEVVKALRLVGKRVDGDS